MRREFDTEIVDQLPDDRITWRVVDGETRQRGSVRFERLDNTHTRVELTMDVEPSGVAEKGADCIEERGGETGAWRGRVRPGNPGSAF